MQLKTALDHSTHPTSCSIQYRFIRTKTSPQSKKPIAVSAAKSNHFVTFNPSATYGVAGQPDLSGAISPMRKIEEIAIGG
jgi:hypothetical protein